MLQQVEMARFETKHNLGGFDMVHGYSGNGEDSQRRSMSVCTLLKILSVAKASINNDDGSLRYMLS